MRRFYLLLFLSFLSILMMSVLTVAAQQDPSDTPFPDPLPVTAYEEFSLWRNFEIPQRVRDGINTPHIVFINSNDSGVTSLATAEPTSDQTILYYVDAANAANLYPILEFTSGTLESVFVSPLGNSIAYLVNDRAGSEGRGLWIVDTGFSSVNGGRILNVGALSNRGITNPPSWSPDGRRLAVVWETGYSLDIFEYDMDATRWRGLVIDGSFNFWPSWSPDGRYLAFVSDRETCSSWIPGDEGACNGAVDPAPRGGHVYVWDATTGVIARASTDETFERPYWVNENLIAFSGGDPFDLLMPERSIWITDMRTMQPERIRLNDSDAPLYLSESWSPDGSRVIAQVAGGGGSTEIVAIRRDGSREGTITQLSFPRYAMESSWASAGDRLVVGGSSGQCPTALRVFNESYSIVGAPSTPTNACEPTFAPDGSRIAFTAVSQDRRSFDGRRDIYVTTRDGFGVTNLTINLRGQMTFIGWVGPR